MDDTTTIDYLNKKIIEKIITHQNIKLYQGFIFEIINISMFFKFTII